VCFLLIKKENKKARDVTGSNGLKHFGINAVTNGIFLNCCSNTTYFFIKKEGTDSSQPYVTTLVLILLSVLYITVTLQPGHRFKSKVCFCWEK